MKRASQLPGVAASSATAGLPSVMPVAISFGHRLSALLTVRLDWLARSGSLKPSRMCPSPRTWASVALVTLAAPQIMGTKLTPLGALTPGPADQV